MAATTTTPPNPNAAGASATGYEAFIQDSGDTSTHHLKAVASDDVSQSKITSHFSQKPGAGEKTITAAGEGEEAPGLTASSSSEESQVKETKEPQENKLSEWADKFSSQCAMNTTCGKFELEFMKKDEAPASRANALTEKGELLAIEALPRPEPWARQVSDATTETLNTVSTKVSTKATDIMVALGLTAKKEQHLMTDYYQAKPKETEKEPEKSLSEKALELQNSVTTKTEALKVSVMSTLGLGLVPEEKEMKQKLITDFDPSPPASMCCSPAHAQLSDDDVMSICTEMPSESASAGAAAVVAAAETQHAPVKEEAEKAEESTYEKVEKSSWKIWEQVKGFMSKFKVPDKAQSFDIPKVDVPSCPSPSHKMHVSTPKIEIPSYTLFSCNPTVASTVSDEAVEETKADESKVEEEAKADESKIEEETKPQEAEKVEDTKAEQSQPEIPETPKSLATPW